MLQGCNNKLEITDRMDNVWGVRHSDVPVVYLSIKGEENRQIHGIVIFKILCLRKPFNNYEIITSKTTFFSFGLNWTFFLFADTLLEAYHIGVNRSGRF